MARRGLAYLAGSLAIGVSVLMLLWVLLLWVTLGFGGPNPFNLWTIVICGLGGVFARELRLGLAALFLVIGAAPTLPSGVGFVYLLPLILVGAAALAPHGVTARH